MVRIFLQYSASQISTVPREVPIARVEPYTSVDLHHGSCPEGMGRLTLLVHSNPVTASFTSSPVPLIGAISHSLVTLLVWADHK